MAPSPTGISSHRLMLSPVIWRNPWAGEKSVFYSLRNTPFFIIAYLAIIKSGNTALLVETQIADEQLASIFRECRIGAVFVQKKYRSKIPDTGSVFTKDHLPLHPGKKIRKSCGQ